LEEDEVLRRPRARTRRRRRRGTGRSCACSTTWACAARLHLPPQRGSRPRLCQWRPWRHARRGQCARGDGLLRPRPPRQGKLAQLVALTVRPLAPPRSRSRRGRDSSTKSAPGPSPRQASHAASRRGRQLKDHPRTSTRSSGRQRLLLRCGAWARRSASPCGPTGLCHASITAVLVQAADRGASRCPTRRPAVVS
jgi:hypothetical protein